MLTFTQRPFESWGRVARRPHAIGKPRFQDQVHGVMASLSRPGATSVLPVGLGRSYGDTCYNGDGRLIDTTGLDRILFFDPARRLLRAEAGASLDAVLRLVVPQGLFPSTTPGTRFVTLGGAVANDVHGKNHETAGSFGLGVRRIGLARSDTGIVELDANTHADLFRATIGGLGLTGVILWVEISLVPIASAYLEGERLAFANLGEFFALSREDGGYDHSVAWIDCLSRGQALGRGIYQRARWCADGRMHVHRRSGARKVPCEAPSWLLNYYSLKAFNALHYQLQKRSSRNFVAHYPQFLYPLDAIDGWNRLYGAAGFFQYQCVLPPEAAEPAMADILAEISRDGSGSFLVVLKRLGPLASPGLISFPRAGYTFAMDFPNRGSWTLELMSRLDAIVAAAGGRLYAAKDGRMPAALFRSGYPLWQQFARFVDPHMSSDFWRRVAS